MAEALKKFGKYFLLDLLAQGGMAEIYRARVAALDSGGRLLAIKRVLRNYSQNAEFMTMFRAEIKTTAGFAHPNIAQVYDFGEEDGMLYIAMEMVDGKNLRQFISRFNELKTTLPVEVSVFIIEQAARALSYAHNFKDPFTGKELNIVHRDISPQNVLISYDGAVKVIDFGIAKAVTNMEATRAGVIKGKPSYLSPEQISGEVLDGRSDIFALGIVLWELLTGKKLFSGENDYAVLKLIENCTSNVKPPSLYNPKIPKELDVIVLKCLQKSRDTRFTSAEEMQRSLHKFLYQFQPDFNPADLAYYARDLFKNEIVEDRKKLQKSNERAEQLLREIATREEDTTVGTKGTDKDILPPIPAIRSSARSETRMIPNFTEIEVGKKTEVKLDFEGSKPASATVSSFNAAERGKSGRVQKNSSSGWGARIALAIGIGIAVAGGMYFKQQDTLRKEKPVDEELATLTIDGNLRAATVTIDGKVVASMLPATIDALPANQPLEIVVSANGYQKFSNTVTLLPRERKTVVSQLARLDDLNTPSKWVDGNNASRTAIRFNVTSGGKTVAGKLNIRVNGDTIDPLSGVGNVPLDTPLAVVIEMDGYRTFRKELVIDSKNADGTEYVMDVPLQAAEFGYLSVKTTPSAEAVLVVDGVEERVPTPFSRKRLPVGTYRIKLLNSLLGMEKEVQVTIGEDKFSNVEERLTVTEDRAVSGKPTP